MPVRGRGAVNLPFVKINWVRHGVFGWPRISSYTFNSKPLRHIPLIGGLLDNWSWNSRNRRHRVDLPGPHHWWQSKGGKK